MTKTLNPSIYSKILNDRLLSTKLCEVFDVKQASVERMARRESKQLLNINAIEVFRSHGFSDCEIFEISAV